MLLKNKEGETRFFGFLIVAIGVLGVLIASEWRRKKQHVVDILFSFVVFGLPACASHPQYWAPAALIPVRNVATLEECINVADENHLGPAECFYVDGTTQDLGAPDPVNGLRIPGPKPVKISQ